MTVATAGLMVRVWVPDVWDVVPLEIAPDTTIAEIKSRALARAIGHARRADPATFVVKYRGALVLDESRTAADLALPDNAPLIVMAGMRRPVR